MPRRRLRALVVLPTKVLAMQVFKVFSYYVRDAFDLKVLLMESANLTLEKEKEKLLKYGIKIIEDIVLIINHEIKKIIFNDFRC